MRVRERIQISRYLFLHEVKLKASKERICTQFIPSHENIEIYLF